MALIVHEPFDLDGKMRKRGDVLFADEADAVTRDPERARRCTAVADEPFEHLRPAAPAPVAPTIGKIGKVDVADASQPTKN